MVADFSLGVGAIPESNPPIKDGFKWLINTFSSSFGLSLTA